MKGKGKGKSKSKVKAVKVIEMPSIFSKVEKTEIIMKDPLNTKELLEYVTEKMDKYKKEKEKANKEKFETDYMNNSLLGSLEKLTRQVRKVEDPYIKSTQIKTLYDWYIERINKYNNIKNIKSRSKKWPYEIIKEKINDKNNYYEAEKYPTFFEKDHRSEDIGILPPKDRLKEFKRKEVDAFSQQQKKMEGTQNEFDDTAEMFYKNNKYENQEKVLSQTASIDNMKSTMYKTQNNNNNFNSTASNFNTTDRSGQSGFRHKQEEKLYKYNSNWNNNKLNMTSMSGIQNPILSYGATTNSFYQKIQAPPNKRFDTIAGKEIKSSYKYYRPSYELSNITIEKNMLREKNRQLAEKRNKEEHKEFINNWGKARSQFKSNLEFKYENIKIANMFEKEIREETMKKKMEVNENRDGLNSMYSHISITNSPLKKQIFKDSVKMNATSANNAIKNNITNINLNNNLKEGESREEDHINTLNANIETNNEQEIINDGVSEIPKDKPILNKVIDKLAVSSNQAIKLNIINNKGKANKMLSEVVKLKPKIISDKASMARNIKVNEPEDAISSDAITFLNQVDPVYRSRRLFGPLIQVKTIDNPKLSYTAHFTPLSFYDLKNQDKCKLKKQLDDINYKFNIKNRPTTGAELLRSKQFNSKNLLESRKTMSSLNYNLCDEINEYNVKKNLHDMSVLNLKSSVLGPETSDNQKYYLKYFLPDPSFGALDKLVDKMEKKKK